MGSRLASRGACLRAGLAACALLLGQGALAAAAQVIETVSLAHSGRSVIASVQLVCPVRVLDYWPREMSPSLDIRVESLGSCPGWEPGTRDQYQLPAAAGNWLESVSFEQDGQVATLHLQFDQPVMAEIQNTGASRLVKLMVFQPMQIRRTLDDSNAWSGSTRFAINLESSRSTIGEEQLRMARAINGQVAYLADVTVKGKDWQRLRLGFFDSEAEARLLLDELKVSFPQAWITRVSDQEVALARDQQGLAAESAPGPRVRPAGAGGVGSNPAAPPPQSAGVPVAAVGAAAAPLTGQPAERMEAARQAMLDQDWDMAVKLLTSVLSSPESDQHPQAREFLGLARERKGQLAHATAEYRRYLQDYPDAEGAERVRQRLVGLVTADEVKVVDRGRGAPGPAGGTDWDAFGSLWQFYYRDVRRVGDQERVVDSVYTNVDMLVRMAGQRFGMTSRVNGGYRHFLNGIEGADDGNTNYAYLEVNDAKWGLLGRIGRQTRHSGGVLGRFDGLYLAYDLTPGMTLNGVAGYTVDSSRESLQTDRSMYGLSMDFADVLPDLGVTVFYHAQDYSGVTDRRAVGGEMRYFNANGNLLGLVDYDTYYGEVNIALLTGSWNLPSDWVVTANLDYRRSPLITSRNALIGQDVQSMDALLAEVGEEEVRSLAADRSAEYQSVMLGISRPLTENLQVKVNASMFNLSGTEASGGVMAMPGTDNEYAYDLQFIGSSLWSQGDMSIMGLRYIDGSRYRTMSLFANARFPLGPSLRIQPRMRVDQRSRVLDTLDEWIVSPSMRLEYRIGPHAIELEAGGEWWRQQGIENDTDASAYFLNLGYRAVF